MRSSPRTARARALRSLEGLSVGDAFGERWFRRPRRLLAQRSLPDPPWPWTDDTHMALSIVEELLEHGAVDPDRLAQRFARRYTEDPARGYGPGARRLLERYAAGADWREEAPRLFGAGSYGNGAAMRVAPLGAYFAEEMERGAQQAAVSARVTHAHPEGVAGAVAVARAAGLAAASELRGREFLEEVARALPPSRTRVGIERAREIPAGEPERAAAELGTGRRVAAFDTVPFCLWVAAHYGGDYAEALWRTVSGLGDRDTTCAIVGGIVALRAEVPQEWLRRREPLPPGFSLRGAT